MSIEYVPAEGKIAVQILDDIDNDEREDQASGSDEPGCDSYNEALIAVCVGVGPKVTTCKKGETVFIYKWARDSGVRVDDDTRIIDAGCVAAKIKQ